MTFQLGAKIKVKKKPKDSVRTETNKKMESTNKTKIKNKKGLKIRTIITRTGLIGKRRVTNVTREAGRTICAISSTMMSLITTKIKESKVVEREEVMEEEIEVDLQCMKDQVLVTREAATSTIEEKVAITDPWITSMAHLLTE